MQSGLWMELVTQVTTPVTTPQVLTQSSLLGPTPVTQSVAFPYSTAIGHHVPQLPNPPAGPTYGPSPR